MAGPKEEDPEVLFRALVAVGTLVSAIAVASSHYSRVFLAKYDFMIRHIVYMFR